MKHLYMTVAAPLEAHQQIAAHYGLAQHVFARSLRYIYAALVLLRVLQCSMIAPSPERNFNMEFEGSVTCCHHPYRKVSEDLIQNGLPSRTIARSIVEPFSD